MRRTSLGINASTLQYQGNYGSDYWKFDNSKITPGVAINLYLTKGIDLTSQLFYGQLTGSRTPATHFTTTLINTNLGLKLKLNNGWALKEGARIQPYLLAASGWTYASREGQTDGKPVDDIQNYVDVMGGAGISFRISDGVSFFIQSSQHLPLNANLDGEPEANTPRWSDRFLQHTAGLTFNLGQANDADEDGVPDNKDMCPGTPSDTEVNERGCPPDDDLDGVPNYKDQCPTQAGTAELSGCPDTDNDGVDDTDDKCPDVAGTAELNGCPDTDKDGITDQEDKCPDTPASATVDATGCSEPAAPAPVSSTDTDGDGVPNDQDRCPTSVGPASNKGCPEIQPAVRQRLQEATKLIGFELNKATLLASSYPTLDTIAKLLGQYPDYSLSIAGHTDSRGPALFNQQLSRQRAAAARTYLLGKGIPENRVELRGYGPRHPVASNDTEAGRTQNRRVEFDLFLTGDVNAAQKKYGAEPQASTAKPSKPVKKAAAKKRTPAKAPVKKRPAAGKKTKRVIATPTTTRRK
ncbi:hypothetical protein GCM10027346_40780 [Hymenobacter seoulensis]